MTDNDLALKEEALHLAQRLFGDEAKKCASFTNRLLDICTRARGKDILLIHNPGGWGSAPLEQLLQWERSIVEGVTATLEQPGCSWLLTQNFRSGNSWWAHIWEIKKEAVFFFKGISSEAEVMAAELRFITRHISNLKVILIGVSSGAAFSNAVMWQLGGLRQVYSIELGIFFPQLSRRVITDRTLAIDNNGLVTDPVVHRNLMAGFKVLIIILIIAPYRWFKCRLEGKPKYFSHCINTPGHEYSWEYPKVRQQIVDFLEINFSTNKSRT